MLALLLYMLGLGAPVVQPQSGDNGPPPVVQAF